LCIVFEDLRCRSSASCTANCERSSRHLDSFCAMKCNSSECLEEKQKISHFLGTYIKTKKRMHYNLLFCQRNRRPILSFLCHQRSSAGPLTSRRIFQRLWPPSTQRIASSQRTAASIEIRKRNGVVRARKRRPHETKAIGRISFAKIRSRGGIGVGWDIGYRRLSPASSIATGWTSAGRRGWCMRR